MYCGFNELKTVPLTFSLAPSPAYLLSVSETQAMEAYVKECKELALDSILHSTLLQLQERTFVLTTEVWTQ